MAKERIIRISKDQFKKHAEERQAEAKERGEQPLEDDEVAITPMDLPKDVNGPLGLDIPSDREGLQEMLKKLQDRIGPDTVMDGTARENVDLLRELHQRTPTLERSSEKVRIERNMGDWSNEELVKFLSDASALQINAHPAYYFALLRQIWINEGRKSER